MISHLQFNIWNIYYYNFTFNPHRLPRTHKWPAPNISGFIAQLVRVSHRYHELTGPNPVAVLTFSSFYICNCINCIHNCEDHRLLDDLFHISFHHSNWLIVDLLSQQILTVLSAFCCHSWASPTWSAGFLYDPIFFLVCPTHSQRALIGNSTRFLK